MSQMHFFGKLLWHLRNGFSEALLGVLRVRPDGLVSMGPPCGSYVWVNRATSGRSSETPYGDETKSYVEAASTNPGPHTCSDVYLYGKTCT